MKQIQVSTKHKLLGVPYADDVHNLFPSAKTMNFGGMPHIILPHDLTETWMLRKLGYDAPAPIISQYGWANGTPFEVQKSTCAQMTLNQRFYVLNDMGTGKTKAALWAWDFLRSGGRCGKLLVAAPLSTLNFTWAREVFTTLPHRKCVVLHGSKAKRLERLADPDAEIFVINHDGIKTILPELIKRTSSGGDIDVLVLDELAIYRNGGAARTKTMRKLAAGMKWVWGMTGSPIPNEVTDVWAQATIVTPHTVPKYFGRFRDELMLKINQFKWAPKSDAVERAYAVLQPAVRFKLDDVVELPDVIERTVDVDLGTEQERIYKELAATCYAGVQGGQITAANAGAVMMKLLQVSAGWVYAQGGQTVPLDNSERIQALIEGIESTDRKVLVFVPFKHALEGVAAALTLAGIDHAPPVSGDTSATERGEIFNLFQNTNKYRVLPAHPQCLAHGITLTAADTVIWFSPTANNEIYDQANRRIRRIGQKHKQQILHLQSTSVERKLYQLLRSKQRVQDKLLSLFEEASR